MREKRLLWLVPTLVLAVPLTVAAVAVPWRAALWDGQVTYLINVARAPLWSRPAAPPVAQFEREFAQPFSTDHPPPVISVSPWPEAWATEAIACIALCAALTVPAYLSSAARPGRRRPLPLRLTAFAA